MNNLFLLNENLFQALGWTIIHSLWQIALIGLLLKAGLWFFRKHSPEVRYNMLLAGVLSILLVSGFTFYKMYDKPVDNISPVITVNIEELAQPISGMGVSEPEVLAFDTFLIDKTRFLIHQNAQIITLFWLIGFMFFSIRFAGGCWYLSRIKRNAILLNKEIIDLSETISTKFSLKKYVKVFESVSVKVPIALGYLKPIIILPAGLATSIPFNQLEAILTHELAHIKRNDFLVNLLKSVLEAIFFYHPVFWWIGKQMDNEREHCCDDITITLCNNKTSLQEALLNIELHNQKLQHIAAALYKNKFQLLNRIKRMKSKNNLNHGNRNTLAGLIVWPALMLIFSLSTAFVPRDNDLPDLNHHLNTFVPVSSGLSVVTAEPIHIFSNTQPILIEDLDLKPLAEPDVAPDTNEVKYGSKIKTDDGFVLLEFDENMNLQKITKDGKELTGEERKKYEKLAEKSKEAYTAEIEQTEKEKEIAELEEKLKEVQERMEDVQAEYNEIMERYMEKSAIAGEFVWPEIYAESFEAARDAQWRAFEKLQESMPQEYDFRMPEIPDYDFDEELLQEQFERAQDMYKDVWKDYKADQYEWKEQWKLEDELRAAEREAWALENESRRLEPGLRSQLLNDGIIDRWDDLKNLTLTEKKLEVNGKKQSQELHKKYLDLYEDLTGKELDGTLEINQH